MNRPTLKLWINRLGPLLALLGVYALFALIAPPEFLKYENQELMLLQTTVVATAAIGMTLVIIAGGIDLSGGSMVALSSVLAAILIKQGHSSLAAAAIAIGAIMLAGLANALIITGLRVVPFIVTLGSLLILRGLAKGISHEQPVYLSFDAQPPALLSLLAQLPADRQWMILPPGVWLMLLLACGTAFMLHYSTFGRHLFAIGSNELTARLCGLRVNPIKWLVYSLCAAFAALAGLMQFSRLSIGDPTTAVGMELDVIAAVVIGGGSLAGGQGSILGTLVGAMILTVIRSGCTQMGLPTYIQEIITGAIIILAVALDRLRHRRMN